MENTTTSLGRRIRRLREAQGLSQDLLAVRAGVHRNYLGLLERGQTGATVETLASLSKALGVRISELVNFDLGADKPTAEEVVIQRITRRLLQKPLPKLALIDKLVKLILDDE